MEIASITGQVDYLSSYTIVCPPSCVSIHIIIYGGVGTMKLN